MTKSHLHSVGKKWKEQTLESVVLEVSKDDFQLPHRALLEGFDNAICSLQDLHANYPLEIKPANGNPCKSPKKMGS